MQTPEPLFTVIKKTIQTNTGWVILEGHREFPTTESNLYCLADNDKVLWKAEKPTSISLYIRVMLSANTLSAYTNTGEACEIDLATGKLISQVSIK